jgi:hypothetical protein
MRARRFDRRACGLSNFRTIGIERQVKGNQKRIEGFKQ